MSTLLAIIALSLVLGLANTADPDDKAATANTVDPDEAASDNITDPDAKAATAEYRVKYNECLTEVLAPNSEFSKWMKEGNNTDIMKGKCARACAMKKFKVLTPDGKINKEMAIEVVKKHLIRNQKLLPIFVKIVDKCMALQASPNQCVSNACEAALEYGECAIKLVKEQIAANGTKTQ